MQNKNTRIVDDGGPAFPQLTHEEGRDGNGRHFTDPGQMGLSVRDVFALGSLIGMLSYSSVSPQHGNWVENCTVGNLAEDAFRYADAMLKARRGGGADG